MKKNNIIDVSLVDDLLFSKKLYYLGITSQFKDLWFISRLNHQLNFQLSLTTVIHESFDSGDSTSYSVFSNKTVFDTVFENYMVIDCNKGGNKFIKKIKELDYLLVTNIDIVKLKPHIKELVEIMYIFDITEHHLGNKLKKVNTIFEQLANEKSSNRFLNFI